MKLLEKLIYVLETTGEKIAMMFEVPDKPCRCNQYFNFTPTTRSKCQHPSWKKVYVDHGYFLACEKCHGVLSCGQLFPHDGGKNYE